MQAHQAVGVEAEVGDAADHHRAAAQAEMEFPAEHGLAAGEEAGGDLEAG